MRGGRSVLSRRATLFGALVLSGAVACGEIIGADFGRYSHDDEGSAIDDAGEGAGGESAEGNGGRGNGGRSSGGTVGMGGRAQPGGAGGVVVGSGGRFVGSGGAPIGVGGTPIGSGGAPVGNGGTLIGSGGAVGNGGGPGCGVGQKICGGICAAPNPGVGCGLTDCTTCPSAPPDAYSICANQQCTFDCYVGFKLNPTGDGCEPDSGGAGGGGGAGGSVGSCDPAQCPSCGLGPCCNLQGRCGCNWVTCV